MRKLVRESDVIDKTNGTELAKAFNYLWEKYIEQQPCDEQTIYEKAYKEGYDKGWSDGNFCGKHKQEPILDRIRAEINSPNRGTCDYFIVDRIEEIIDKHKESEEKE